MDVGDTGRQSDGSVYNNSYLGHAIDNNLLSIPSLSKIKNSEKILPYVFIADDAFSLKTNMMKPYPSQEQRIFNYRLSRARRTIENAFGIAASRFRIFHRPIIANIETVKSITKAIVALHNFLISFTNNTSTYSYCLERFVDQESRSGFISGEWRQDENNIFGMQDITKIGSNNYSKTAKEVRDLYKDYFNNEGAVEWQTDLVNRLQ